MRVAAVHWIGLAVFAICSIGHTTAADDVVRSANSGPWSAGATWEGGKTPGDGAKVFIRPGHAVSYDVNDAKLDHERLVDPAEPNIGVTLSLF